MSSFLGTPSGVGLGQWQVANDIRLWDENCRSGPLYAWVDIDEPWHHLGFATKWWPGGAGLDASGGEWHKAVAWGFPEFYSGAVSRVVFTGVTRDVFGTALGGCLVKLFKSTTNANGAKDTLIDEVTSDPSGNFTVQSPYYPDTHYLVSYKTGTPDVEGTTVNTLIGA